MFKNKFKRFIFIQKFINTYEIIKLYVSRLIFMRYILTTNMLLHYANSLITV